ncbi:MAG: tetratricopeptide repeat protein [Rhizobiaceae bacterium]
MMVMLKDRYDNPLSTQSNAARDCYVKGVDLLIGGDAGVEAALKEAISYDKDFALAHLALARAKQGLGKAKEVAEPLSCARELVDSVSNREASAIDALTPLLQGKAAEAYPKIRAHVAEFPRDVLLAQTCTSVFGLIGFSGLPGREAEQLAYTTFLQPYYGDDWWFLCQHAFAQMEVGQLEPARKNIERSLELDPTPAHSVHVMAHLHYERGETQEGLGMLTSYQTNLDRNAQMHCHVSWHVGLWALETGDTETMWRVIDHDISPDHSAGPPINILTDCVALLTRAELKGVEVPKAHWRRLSAYASERFPTPGIAFADVHAALAHAMAGEGEGLEKIIKDARGPALETVRSLSEAFGAYAKQQWQEAVNGFVSVMAEHERIGGSRAQRDLIEYALTGALLRLGKTEEAHHLLAIRRPHISIEGAVAGLS